MNNPEKNELPEGRRQELDESWLDASLGEMYRGETTIDQKNLSSVMKIVRGEEASRESESVESDTSGQKWNSPNRYVSVMLSLAAMVLLALYFWPPSSSLDLNKPNALVHLCSQSWKRYPYRHYKVTGLRDGGLEVDADFWVKSDSRFVIKLNRPNGRIMWIGGDRDSRWMVPEIGPVVLGKPGLLAKFFRRSQSDSGYLSMESLLIRLPDFYSAKPLQKTRLKDPATKKKVDGFRFEAECQPGMWRMVPSKVVAVVVEDQKEIVDLKLEWETAGPFRLQEIRFQLQGYPDLEPDWFDWESHARSSQRVIRKRDTDLGETT